MANQGTSAILWDGMDENRSLCDNSFTKSLILGSSARRQEVAGWARLVSNQRPLACEASALPLSYAPGFPGTGRWMLLGTGRKREGGGKRKVLPANATAPEKAQGGKGQVDEGAG